MKLRKVFTFVTLFLVFVLCTPSLLAQDYSRKQDIVLVNSSNFARVVAGASIYICTNGATGTPCTPQVTVYSSTTGGSIVQPVIADINGNYVFYTTPGKYTVQISGVGLQTATYNDVIVASDPVNPTFGVITFNVVGSPPTVDGSFIYQGIGNLGLYTKDSNFPSGQRFTFAGFLGSGAGLTETDCVEIAAITTLALSDSGHPCNVAYSHTGVLVVGYHAVSDVGTLSGGSLAVTLTNGAVFTGSSTYNCKATDTTTPTNLVTPTFTSGTVVTFAGTGTDSFNYTCWGY